MNKFKPPRQLQTPVLFLVFNRPEKTRLVFEAIRKAKPPKLYIAADGPRLNKQGEARLVDEVRKVVEFIDWPCVVKTLFRDKNLGCKYAVSSAITWFFDHEEQGIILEDDCLPVLSFFWYCEDLLNKYKHHDSIYLVSGDARGPESFGMKEDYALCKYPMIWGWATWARVWKKYDVEISEWPDDKNLILKNLPKTDLEKDFWIDIFNKLRQGNIDTWDYQLCHLLFKNNSKCIVPRVNLVTNIGFGAEATHTLSSNCEFANRPSFDISLPLDHTLNLESERIINAYFESKIFFNKTVQPGLINKIRNFLNLIHGILSKGIKT